MKNFTVLYFGCNIVVISLLSKNISKELWQDFNLFLVLVIGCKVFMVSTNIEIWDFASHLKP